MEWAALWPRLGCTRPRSFFSEGPSCFTWILLYDTNSPEQETILLLLYAEQFKEIYSAAVFLHNPNRMNKLNVDPRSLLPFVEKQTQGFAG